MISSHSVTSQALLQPIPSLLWLKAVAEPPRTRFTLNEARRDSVDHPSLPGSAQQEGHYWVLRGVWFWPVTIGMVPCLYEDTRSEKPRLLSLDRWTFDGAEIVHRPFSLRINCFRAKSKRREESTLPRFLPCSKPRHNAFFDSINIIAIYFWFDLIWFDFIDLSYVMHVQLKNALRGYVNARERGH